MVCAVLLFNHFNSVPDQSIPAAEMPVLREDSETSKQEQEKEIKTVENPVIMIDVQGSVKNPGVYKMRKGDRILHAIKKAGGFLEDAEIRSINQAQKISDEMVIYVAAEGEEYEVQSNNSEGEKNEKINVNSADSDQLQTLSGVGPSKANSIIAYRDENGPFTSIEQLLEIRGIGEKTIEEWGDKIKFD